MPIEFDPAKRRRVLQERGLDLALCDEVFARFHLTRRDEAHSDEEARFTTLGLIGETAGLGILLLAGRLPGGGELALGARELRAMPGVTDRERDLLDLHAELCRKGDTSRASLSPLCA